MIYTGTCSWAEKSLIDSKEFYPKEVSSAESRLRYYADNFATVEVDSSYYAIPNIRTVWLWAERTPENFIFHIKSYGALTGHGIDPRALPKDIFSLLSHEEREERYIYIKEPELFKTIAERFIDSLTPLKESGKLGIIVFQYPPWFHYKTSGLDFILKCKEAMKGMAIAVEFRHGSWLRPKNAPSVFDFLRKNRITYITADEPQYDSLATIPFLPEVTTETAYVRLHGRNKENWLKKGIETSLRYNYLYSDEELRRFTPAIKELDKRAEKTYVMFNNCHGSSAIRNALDFRDMIKADNSA